MRWTWRLVWMLCAVRVICAAPICGNGSTVFTITSQGDADALSSCAVVNGSVTVVSDTLQSLTLGGVEEISQNLVVWGCSSLRRLSAPTLRAIDANFTLQDLELLEAVEFPALQNVTGWLNWQGLLSLEVASFPAGLSEGNEVGNLINGISNSVVISNTALSNLTGLEYVAAQSIQISHNPKLGIVNLTRLHVVYGSLDIEANAPDTIIALPALAASNNAFIGSAGEIISPNWTTVYGVLNFTGNTIRSLQFTTLAAISSGVVFEISNNALLANVSFPKLEGDGSLLIRSNAALNSISLPKASALKSLVVKDNPVLNTISAPSLTLLNSHSNWNEAFTVSNNSKLVNISSFQNLATIEGVTTLDGNFAVVSFPSLIAVYGAFRLNTTVSGFDCTIFDNLAQRSITGSPYYSERYHCSAIAPGSSKDSAIHAAPLQSSSPSVDTTASLSGQEKIGIAFGCVAACVFASLITARYYRNSRRCANPQPTCEGEVGLDTILPRYRADALPGEAPPRYKENESIHEVNEVRSSGDLERSPESGPNHLQGGHDGQTEFENAVTANGTDGISLRHLGHSLQGERDGFLEEGGMAGTREN